MLNNSVVFPLEKKNQSELTRRVVYSDSILTIQRDQKLNIRWDS